MNLAQESIDAERSFEEYLSTLSPEEARKERFKTNLGTWVMILGTIALVALFAYIYNS